MISVKWVVKSGLILLSLGVHGADATHSDKVLENQAVDSCSKARCLIDTKIIDETYPANARGRGSEYEDFMVVLDSWRQRNFVSALGYLGLGEKVVYKGNRQFKFLNYAFLFRKPSSGTFLKGLLEGRTGVAPEVVTERLDKIERIINTVQKHLEYVRVGQFMDGYFFTEAGDDIGTLATRVHGTASGTAIVLTPQERSALDGVWKWLQRVDTF